MDSIIVGDKGASIYQIVDLLTSSPVSTQLFQKLADISRSLNVPSEEWEQLRLKLLHDKIQNTDALVKVLELWRARAASAATLQRLVDVLKQKQLNEMADILIREFNQCHIKKTTYSSSSKVVHQDGDQIEYIREHLDGLVENTTVTVALLNKLEARRILHSDEVEELQSTNNKTERNMKFWKMMMKKPGYYKLLIEVLTELCQSGTVKILNGFYKYV